MQCFSLTNVLEALKYYKKELWMRKQYWSSCLITSRGKPNLFDSNDVDAQRALRVRGTN